MKILQHIPMIIWKRGDLSLQFFRAGQRIFDQLPAVTYIKALKALELSPEMEELIKSTGGSVKNARRPDTIEIGVSRKLPDARRTKIQKKVILSLEEAFQKKPRYDEEGHLQYVARTTTRSANPHVTPNELKILETLSGQATGDFVGTILTNAIRDITTHTRAQIRFHHLSKADGNEVDVHVSLHNACSTCATSPFTTLNVVGVEMQRAIFNKYAQQTGGLTIGSIIVEPANSSYPNEGISPSYSHRPDRDILNGKKPVKYNPNML